MESACPLQFVGRIRDEWEIIDPEVVDGPSMWKYAADIGGEHLTIAQLVSLYTLEVHSMDDTHIFLNLQSEVRSRKDQMPAILLLSKQRSCDRGQFAFKFFPQCEGRYLIPVHRKKWRHKLISQ